MNTNKVEIQFPLSHGFRRAGFDKLVSTSSTTMKGKSRPVEPGLDFEMVVLMGWFRQAGFDRLVSTGSTTGEEGKSF